MAALPIFIDKLLTSLGYPLGFAVMLIVFGLLMALFGLRRIGMSAVTVAVLALWVASMPSTAMRLTAYLESQYPAHLVEDYPAVDVAVVLGGGLEQPSDRNPYPDLHMGADRVIHGYRILKAGKAKKLLLSGGHVFAAEGTISEAEAMADLLVSLGVDRNLLITETKSRNTHENALFSADLFKQHGFQSGLLVTSATHMPRALSTFRKAGLALDPATTDVSSDNNDDLPFPLNVLPDAGSLLLTSAALKEIAGLLVYQWRGWA